MWSISLSASYGTSDDPGGRTVGVGEERGGEVERSHLLLAAGAGDLLRRLEEAQRRAGEAFGVHATMVRS
jgi:hypothetical protein